MSALSDLCTIQEIGILRLHKVAGTAILFIFSPHGCFKRHHFSDYFPINHKLNCQQTEVSWKTVYFASFSMFHFQFILKFPNQSPPKLPWLPISLFSWPYLFLLLTVSPTILQRPKAGTRFYKFLLHTGPVHFLMFEFVSLFFWTSAPGTVISF